MNNPIVNLIILILVLITIYAFIVAYKNIVVIRPPRKFRATIAFLTGVGCIYNIWELLLEFYIIN